MRRSRAAAYDSSQPSTTGMRSSAMPFCGPKVLAAPNRPVSWLSTSLAATTATSPSAGPGGRDVDGGDAVEAGRPRVQRTVGRGAEGRQQPGATVGGPAAAEAHHDLPGPGVDRGQDQLADAAGRGLLGALAAGQVQSAGLGALDVRRRPGEQHGRGRRLPEGAGDRHGQHLAPQRLVQHVDEPGTAVGHRREVELVVRRLPPPALGDRLRPPRRRSACRRTCRGPPARARAPSCQR